MTRNLVRAGLAVLGIAGATSLGAAEYEDTLGQPTRGVAIEAPYNKPGVEYGNSAPGGGYTLLRTIPAAANTRLGYVIQSQCTAGLIVSFEDVTAAGGGTAPTYIALAGASAPNSQGGTMDMGGMPYSGQMKVFSTDPDCPFAAWINQ